MTTVRRTISAKARKNPYLPDLKESLDKPPDVGLADKEDVQKHKQRLKLENELQRKRKEKADNIFKKLNSCRASTPPDKKDYQKRSKEFENICEELINLTFKKEFHNCKSCTQEREISFAGDLLRVLDISIFNLPQDDHPNSIWNDIKKEDKYNCQKIIFECKNYSLRTKIRKEEIYQLYEYLDPQNIGRFGIILNKYGFSNLDKKAKAAIKRVKKDRYLILVLGKEEIQKWLEEWVENETCHQFFSEQISRFMSLSK